MEKRTVITVIRLILILIVLANILFIWNNSAENGAESKGKSDKIVDIVDPIINKDGEISKDTVSFYVRKGAHFTEYAILGAFSSLLYLSFLSFDYKKIKAHCIFVPMGVFAVAGIDETIQKFYERTSSIKDVILDSIGGIFGIIVLSLLFALIAAIVKRVSSKRI